MTLSSSFFLSFCEPKANCDCCLIVLFVFIVDFDNDFNGLLFISFADFVFIHLTHLFGVRTSNLLFNGLIGFQFGLVVGILDPSRVESIKTQVVFGRDNRLRR